MSLLFELWPALRERLPWLPLGNFPTPVEDATRRFAATNLDGELWLKRDDLSSPVYAGNKLRLLEHALGDAQRRGMRRVFSSGAVGSNFAIATALHAPRVGLAPGAICFPQPLTPEAEQSHAVVAARSEVHEVAHWSLLGVGGALAVRRAEARGEPAEVLSQLATSPESLFGYVAAGLELARQISARDCPLPTRIVLPIGSASTSAGILAGLSLGRKMGLFSGEPTLWPVRIAAWPLSRRGRVLGLALKALAGLAAAAKSESLALSKGELLPLELVTNQLGAGYPHATPAGRAARAAFEGAGYSILDDTYSAKAAAHLFVPRVGAASGPTLFWCTKSSAPLPPPDSSAPG